MNVHPGGAPERPWHGERHIDVAWASARIARHFPDLAGEQVVPLGEGWDNAGFVAGVRVFRFPRKAEAVPLMEAEIAALPWLGPRLPWPVPVPDRVGRDEEGWPFAGYVRLSGRPVTEAALDDSARAALAEPFGRFLAALHALPAEEARARGLGGDRYDKLAVDARIPTLHARLGALEDGGVSLPGEAMERLLDETPRSAPAGEAVCHGDLGPRHVLVDDRGSPTGVIDWGDVHVGHPAADLSAAFGLLPPGSRPSFRAAYGPVDDATWTLARFRAAFVQVSVAWWAADLGDDRLLAEAARALGWVVT